MKMSEMNSNQKEAYRQVVHASNWIVGGYENAIMDGEMDEMPSRVQLIDEIYWQVMNCFSTEGRIVNMQVPEVRFAGKKFIMERIENRLTKMGIEK